MSAADSLDGRPRVSTQRVGAALVVSIGGDVDHATIPEVQASVATAVTGEPVVLVVDLSAVTFLDSAGLALMVSLHAQRPGRLRLVAPTSVARRPIEITGLNHVLAVFGTLADALAVGPNPRVIKGGHG